MAGTLFQLPKATPMDNGVTVPGAKLTFTQTGTTTPQNVYQDLDLSTAHSNPVVADAEGVFAPIYLDPSLPAYRVKLTDASDTLIYQVDDVPSGLNTAVDEFTITGDAPYIDLIEEDASTDSGGWRIQATGDQLIIYAMNDAKSVFTKVLEVDRTGTTLDSVKYKDAELATVETGTFTGTLTGVSDSPAPTATFHWARSGHHVTIWLEDALTGTSNTTLMTVTGLPAGIRPVSAQKVPCAMLSDGTETAVFGYADVTNTTTIAFALAKDSDPSGYSQGTGSFTASGTKGLGERWSITYQLT